MLDLGFVNGRGTPHSGNEVGCDGVDDESKADK
jgi:hypothetical protein